MILLEAVSSDTIKQAIESLFALAVTGFGGIIAKNHQRIRDEFREVFELWRQQRFNELKPLEDQVNRVERTMLDAISRQDSKIEEIGRINADTHDKVIQLTAAMHAHDDRASETRKDIAAYRQEIQGQMNQFSARLDRHIEAN